MTATGAATTTPVITGIFLWTLGLLLRVIEGSGAIPRSEFAPAGPLYDATPFLFLAGGLATALSVVSLWRAAEADAARAVSLAPATATLGAGLVLAALVRDSLFPYGLTLFVVGTFLDGMRRVASEADDASARIAEVLGRLVPRRLVVQALRLVVLTSVSALLLAGIEYTLFTIGFVPDIVRADEVHLYRALLPAVALFVGIAAAGPALVVLALVLVVIRGLRRVLGRTPVALAWLTAAALGQAIGIGLVWLVRKSLDDEIDQVGVTVHVLALGVLGGGLVARALHGRRLLDPAAPPPVHAPDVVGDLVSRLLWPPLGTRVQRALVRRPGHRRLAILTTASVLLAITGFLLYPRVEDFRLHLFDSLALVAVLLTAALLGQVGPRPGPRGLALCAAVVVAAGLSSWVTIGTRSEARLVAHEYSRFGALGTDTDLARLLDSFESIGFGEARSDDLDPPVAARDRSPLAGLDRPLVVVVLWDAARPDHLEPWGYDRRTTPNLAALAEEAVVFEHARSLATATSLGVRQLMTGRYVSRYMLETDHAPFFVAHLAAGGYRRFVVTVTDNDLNGVSARAFRRGWVSDAPGLEFTALPYVNLDYLKPDRKKTDDVLAELRSRVAREGPDGVRGAFAYIHLTGPHTPWKNDEPVIDFGPRPLDRYDGELAKVDALLGRLIEELRSLRVWDRTVLVITADHGTGLGDHGRFAGFLPYEEQLRIPLVVRVPGLAPRRVAEPVAGIDLAPTLVDLVAPGVPLDGHGRSLVPLMTGEREQLAPRDLVAFCAFRDSYALLETATGLKLHHHRGLGYEALFDLRHDPGERENLVSARPEDVLRLRRRLDEFLRRGRSSYGNPYHYRAWDGAPSR